MTAVYICGDSASPANCKGFWATEKLKAKFKSVKCRVIYPGELPLPQLNWSDTLQCRIEELKKCQAIYVLPNWKEDIMSRIELTIALDLNLETIFHPIPNTELRKVLTSLDN